MKANRKFVKDSEAVSPVIAVILMVAVTVVLSATVYVWASGFGGRSDTPKAMTIVAQGVLQDGVKEFTVASATPGTYWRDVRVSVDGVPLQMNTTAACPTPGAGEFVACSDATQTSNDLILAGQSISVPASPGSVVRIIDVAANSVMVTVTVG